MNKVKMQRIAVIATVMVISGVLLVLLMVKMQSGSNNKTQAVKPKQQLEDVSVEQNEQALNSDVLGIESVADVKDKLKKISAKDKQEAELSGSSYVQSINQYDNQPEKKVEAPRINDYTPKKHGIRDRGAHKKPTNESALQNQQMMEIKAETTHNVQLMFAQLSKQKKERPGNIQSGYSNHQQLEANQLSQGVSTSKSKGDTKPEVIIKAGTRLFAVTENEMNSDDLVEGSDYKVTARLLNGKFRGAKLLGTFKTTRSGERLVLQFDMLIHGDDTYHINAIAVDENTSRAGLADDVNHHYFMRYGSLFTSAFAEGFADALSNGNKIIVVADGAQVEQNNLPNAAEQAKIALGNVGKRFVPIAQRQFNTPPTVVVHKGTGMGVQFLENVETK